MAELLFPVTPPRQSTMFAGCSVTEYIRHPDMLAHLKAKSELDLNEHAQARLEPIPIRSNDDMLYVASTEPVNEHGKLLIKLPRGEGFDLGKIFQKYEKQKDTIKKLISTIEEVKDRIKGLISTIEEAKTEAREAKIEAREAKTEAREAKTEAREAKIEAKESKESMEKMEMASRRANNHRFTMFKSNLLMEFVKKLGSVAKKSPSDKTFQAGNDAGHQGTKWAQLAASFSEAEIKKYTDGFDICQKSSLVMKALAKYSLLAGERNETAHEAKLQMAELLVSPSYDKTNDYFFWGAMFRYVFDQTVEDVTKQSDEDKAKDEREFP